MRTLPILVALAACTHEAAPSAPPRPQGPPVILAAPQHPAPVPTGKVGWATWSHDQKLEYMKTKVMPAAREMFAQWMPVRFAKMDCETCHGAGARDGTYKMPNPDLPRLVGGKGGFEEMAAREHDTLKFMQGTLVPDMANLLGYQPFDWRTHTGFSCYQCHVQIGVAE